MPTRAPSFHNNKAALTAVALLAVLAVAAWFRFYNLQHYPPGLFPDQAANGEDALLILNGDLRPFYERGNGREALFFYLQAASIKLFGIGVWPMFAASAAVGVATVAAIFFATRIYFGRLSALLAALFLATSYWHVTLSRTGFRAILIPFVVAAFTASVGYMIAAVKANRRGTSYLFAALAGGTFMAGFYTYIAYRIMVGVLLGMVLIMLLAALHPRIGFPHLRRYRSHLVIAALVGLIVFAPLGLYFLQHPGSFVGRAGQVSVLNESLQQDFGGGELVPTILYSLRTTVLAFFAGPGDTNWRHSVAGFPLLNPLVGVLVLLGFAWAIHGTVTIVYAMRRGQEVHLGLIYPYLLLLLMGMLVPVITTAEGLPHGLRSLGLIVPLFVLAGTAGSVIIYWCKRRLAGLPRAVVYGVVVGALVVAGAYDGALYFFMAARDSDAHYAYRADLTATAAYLNDFARSHPASPRPYLVLDQFSLQTVHYLTSVAPHEHTIGDAPHPDAEQHRWRQLNPATSELTWLQPGEIIIFTQSTMPDAERYEAVHDEVELLEQRRNRFDQETMRVYHRRDDATLTPGEGEGGDSLDA